MKSKRTSSGPNSLFESLMGVDYINLILVCLYLLVDYIPKGDAIDFNGPQWMYLGAINLVAILYFFSANKHHHNDYNIQFSHTVFTIPVLLYGAFFILAGASYFFAFNKNEFLVCYARCAITFIGFVNLIIAIQRSEKLLPYISQIIAIILLLKCIDALQGFFSDVSTNGVFSAIVNMKGDTGNKNIFSSGIVIKLPFVLFCLYNGKKYIKLLNFIILTIALYTLFLANARSAFIGVFAELLVYSIFCIYNFTSHKDGKSLIQQLAYFLIPIVICVLLSQITIDTQRRSNVETINGGYGTVTERVGSISLSDSGSSGRIHIWEAAVALFKSRPLTGAGYGNWKISSIPFDRLDNNDNDMNVHAHNDFLEEYGELGIVGGTIYLLLFLVVPLISLKNLFSKNIPNENKLLLLLSLIGIGGYFIDAVFNFPMERATMQLYFMLFFAINVIENYRLKKYNTTLEIFNFNRLRKYVLAALLLAIPCIYITYQTWQSMVVQSTVFEDVNAEVVTHKSYDINDQFPSLTNLTMWGLPISCIKARYLIAEKKFDEAVSMLNQTKHENPYLYYAEFLKGRMYFENNQFDSAYKYAKIAFDNRPRNLAYFGLIAFACANKNDSLRLKRDFYLLRKYRKDAEVAKAWNNYLYALTVMKYPVPYMLKVADSALVLYPTDSVTISNSKTMHVLAGDKPTPVATNTAPTATQIQAPVPQQNGAVPPGSSTQQLSSAALKDSAIFYDLFKRGNESFIKSDFKTAIGLFENARKINPNFYPALENIGLSYFLMRDFGTAVKYLNMVLETKASNDGKAEYYLGISLINTGRKEEGCQSFLNSEAKKYYDARRLYDLNCVPQAAPPNQ